MSLEYHDGASPSPLSTAGDLPLSPSVSPASIALDKGSRKTTPRLGDFSKVLASKSRPLSQASSHISIESDVKDHQYASRRFHVETLAKSAINLKSRTLSTGGDLGNFSKIFQHFAPPTKSIEFTENLSSSLLSSSPRETVLRTEFQRSTLLEVPSHLIPQRGITSIAEDAVSDASLSGDDSLLGNSPPITSSTSWEEEIPPIKLQTETGKDEETDLVRQIHRAKLALLKAQTEDRKTKLVREVDDNEWLCDWVESNGRGTRHPIREKLWTKSEAHKRLSNNMTHICALDGQMSQCFPVNATHGVHIFLDYSNINISFQQFLRYHYKLPKDARFSPTPNISLEYLHELLLRGRQPQTLFAGGSVGHKDRHEPYFVKELRNLNYIVDLRERVRVEELSVRGLNRASGKSSSDEASCARNARGKPVKYKEEFVDESLQSRIASITLDFLDTPGTLVFVTGDGKPAPYADGFVKYAERALKRGFNIEVVSWSRNLSSAWNELKDAVEWEGRFRVIELDKFWKELISVFARS